MPKSLAFIQHIINCDLIDAGFSGPSFTWCNGWSPDKRGWQRLDRELINNEWCNIFDTTNIEHLIKTGSDHSPLLIIIAKSNTKILSNISDF